MYKFQFHLCFCYTFTVLWFIFQESFVYEWYQVTTLKLIYQIKTEESSIVDKRHRQWHQVGVFFHWQSFGSFQASMCFFSEELVPSLEAHGISEEMFCDSSDVLCDNKNVCVCVSSGFVEVSWPWRLFLSVLAPGSVFFLKHEVETHVANTLFFFWVSMFTYVHRTGARIFQGCQYFLPRGRV